MRARLAELNRAPLPTAVAVSNASPARVPAAEKPQIVHVISKPHTAPARCELETPVGNCWLIERPLGALWPEFEDRLAGAPRILRKSQRDPAAHSDWRAFARHFPQRTVYLDLETCGFAGSMVFLVGVVHMGPDGVMLSQMLARNYAEEAAMLCALWERMDACEVLITFNGKSFDWPMVQDRNILHRIDRTRAAREPTVHVDVLHHARRRYRRELPNCRLQTLEWYLCGRRRVGDIPGSKIPDAYHQYVRTGDESQMQSILHHNALDLVTLLQLSLRMAADRS